MRKLLLIVFLVAAFVVPASATWTLVQQFISPANCTPGVLTCSISVSSTGSGNVIVVWIEINGVGAVPTTISAVTGGGAYTLGSTFGCNTFVSSHAIDCALTLSSTSGATTIAITRSNNTGAPQFKVGGAEKYLSGSVILTFGDKDPQDICRALCEFSKTNEKWKSAGVIFEGQVFGEDFIKQLSKLPSRKELLTQLVLRMNSPIQGFANVLGALTRNLVVALEEVRKKKAAAGAAS